MQSSRSVALSLSLLALLVVHTAPAARAQPAPEYKPKVGQAGKDVVWVPTPQTLVDRMLEIAKVTPQDYVVDLGSGDGRTVITAARIGATALGIEFNPSLVALSKRDAEVAGVSGRATFLNADIFATDFSRATVVTMFLLPSLNVKLRPTILDMKPGTRVVSNSFDMGDWKPDQTAYVTRDCTGYCRAHLWIVPAKVEGTWKLGDSWLTLKQRYQFFEGSLTTGNVVSPITDGKLAADRITFAAAGRRYTAQVSGAEMEGTSSAGGGTETQWRAIRKLDGKDKPSVPTAAAPPAKTPPAPSPPIAASKAPGPAPSAVATDASQMSGRRVALVIGNAAYKVGPLQNPVNDAAAIAEALRGLGFNKVVLKRDLTLDDFRAALRAFSRDAAGADMGVVYFAGHGTEVNRRNFLIPVDAALARAADLELEAVALETVLTQLEDVRKLKLVILDACRNNIFPLAGAQRSVGRGLARIEPVDNTLVVYAAKEGTTADDGPGRRHSPFTEALLKRIATPEEISFVFRLVRDDVLKATGNLQQPFIYGTLGGEKLYLRRP
jgi:hypothetical protein